MIKIFKINDNVKLYSLNNSENFDEKIAEVMSDNINKGLCLLPGGSTPLLAYQILSKNRNIKPARKVLITDDRLVDLNSSKSNYTMLRKNLKIGFLEGYPLSYFNEINSYGLTRANEKIDNIIRSSDIECSFLGLGEDSHTASLFPNNSEILGCESSGLIVRNANEDFSRYSLSYQTILSSKKIIFLIKGENKLNALISILSNEKNYPQLPAQKIINEHENIQIFCDFKFPINKYW
tara:strand:- start:1185 stop:1892 length:708 start_codon:yes stop_codon:yes gene_type:complete